MTDNLISRATVSAGNKSLEVLNSKPVQDQWIGWLGQAFCDKQTTDALLYLLINGITDKKFVDQSIPYGLKLITHAV